MSKILVCISGASGVNLGIKLAYHVSKIAKLHLVISNSARQVLLKEQGVKLQDAMKNEDKFTCGAKNRAVFSGGTGTNRGVFDGNTSGVDSKASTNALNLRYAASDTDQISKTLSQSFAPNLPQNLAYKKLLQMWQETLENAQIYDDTDLSAPPSSGSFGIEKTIVAPCSINTLAKISCGIAGTLITRAAAVALKERRALTLGVREMPFSAISLRQMADLSALGVVIAPPILGYYGGAASLEDMENFIIGKWLDTLGLKNRLYKRWQNEI